MGTIFATGLIFASALPFLEYSLQLTGSPKPGFWIALLLALAVIHTFDANG